ncbi:hypothetical protein HNR77_005854 [Paenibacillus sp. JGP012]|nr:hypothetical protein [Paenibacillus sp. JGP012]
MNENKSIYNENKFKVAIPLENNAMAHWGIRRLVAEVIGREVAPADNPASLSLTTCCATLHLRITGS